MYKKVTYIRMRKFMAKKKKKSVFIPMKVQLITNSSVIPNISEINNASSSLIKKQKKKSLKREIKRGKEKKRECERKGKRDEKEGEGEERREKERIGENRESDTKSVPPSPNTFPSTKLGNNITPIKGKLGKNTTPTGREVHRNRTRIHRQTPREDDRALTLPHSS